MCIEICETMIYLVLIQIYISLISYINANYFRIVYKNYTNHYATVHNYPSLRPGSKPSLFFAHKKSIPDSQTDVITVLTNRESISIISPYTYLKKLLGELDIKINHLLIAFPALRTSQARRLLTVRDGTAGHPSASLHIK